MTPDTAENRERFDAAMREAGWRLIVQHKIDSPPSAWWTKDGDTMHDKDAYRHWRVSGKAPERLPFWVPLCP